MDLDYEYTSDVLNKIRVWRFTAAMQEDGDLTAYDERNLKPLSLISLTSWFWLNIRKCPPGWFWYSLDSDQQILSGQNAGTLA